MQILLTTKDTREGAALPHLRTICYRHLSAAPTQTALSRTKSTEREEDHTSHRHAEEKARIGGKRLQGRMITFAGADDNVCRDG